MAARDDASSDKTHVEEEPSPSHTRLASTSAGDVVPASASSSKLSLPDEQPPPYSIFSGRAKWAVVGLVMIAGIFSPLSANSYFPAIPSVAEDLGVSVQNINLSVTLFMVVQGISPTLWGATCDVIGRRPVYLMCFTIYIATCLGLAFTQTYWLLMLLRCLQAAGSASVVALGAGTIGDLAPPKERGGYMGIYSLGAMLGPCIGPLAGGLLADRWDWHAIFFFLAAFSAVVFCVMLLALPETLRSMVGNGSIPPTRLVNRSLVSVYLARRQQASQVPAATLPPRPRRSINPFASLVMLKELDVFLLLIFNAIVYSLFYASTTSFSPSVKAKYGLSESALGLCYLANGGGMICASACNGPRLNRDYRVVSRRHEEQAAERGEKVKESQDPNDLGDFPIEHARLRSLPYSFVLMLVVSIVYGWTVEKGVHLSVPLICQFGSGFASMTQFTSISTLLIDLFPKSSASATASNNLVRCLMGAGATAVIDPIIARMGNGWAFTMLSLITLASGPLLLIEWRKGMSIRHRRAARLARAEGARGAKEATRLQAKEEKV